MPTPSLLSAYGLTVLAYTQVEVRIGCLRGLGAWNFCLSLNGFACAATVLEALRCFSLLFCKALGFFLAMAKGLLTTKAGHMGEEAFQTFT